MLSLGDFLYFFGAAMLVTTALVAVLKTEEEEKKPGGEDGEGEEEEEETLMGAYAYMWRASCEPQVQLLFLMLLTYRAGFAVADNVTHLKMIEYVQHQPRAAAAAAAAQTGRCARTFGAHDHARASRAAAQPCSGVTPVPTLAGWTGTGSRRSTSRW